MAVAFSNGGSSMPYNRAPTLPQKVALDYVLPVLDVQGTSSPLELFSIVPWGLRRICHLPEQKNAPSLIESLSRLGIFFASAGLSLSLLQVAILPAICCATVLMIFKLTIRTTKYLERMRGEIERLESVNLTLTKTTLKQGKHLTKLKARVSELQTLINDAGTTVEHLQELKAEEQKQLSQLEKIKMQYEAVATLLQQENAHLTVIRKDFSKEVARLSDVRSAEIA